MNEIGKIKESNSSLYLARHITVDYYECDNEILSDSPLLENILIESAVAIGATIITSNFHNFEPQGVSGVVILSESHFTIHSWPEYGYAAVDMFACGDMQFEKGIALLTETFKSKKVKIITDLKRGLITNNTKSLLLKNQNNNWEKTFNKNNIWGIATSIDIYGCNHQLIKDKIHIKKYVKELCKLIDMKTFGETNVVHFGEDEKVAGFSMTQLIETSLISGHFANSTNVAYIDIFSCKYYSPSIIANFTVNFFKGEYYKLNVNMRDDK